MIDFRSFSGNDFLEGGYNHDIYVFGRGYSHDTISSKLGLPKLIQDFSHTYRQKSTEDTLYFVDLLPEDINAHFIWTGYQLNLVISIKDTGDTVTILDFFGEQTQFNDTLHFQFEDGTVQSLYDFFAAFDNKINIVSEAIESGNYSYSFGVRELVYGDQAQNLIFNNICSNSLQRWRIITGSGDDSIHSKASGSEIFSGAGQDTLRASASYNSLFGGEGNDTLQTHLSSSYCILDGGSGDDTLIGSYGSYHYYLGGAGNDTIRIERAEYSTFDGGTGDDYLIGTNSRETYIFRAGDGQDTVLEYDSSNTLSFEGTLTPKDIWFELVPSNDSRFSQDLILHLVGLDDQIKFLGWDPTNGQNLFYYFKMFGYKIEGNSIISYINSMLNLGAPQGSAGQWSSAQTTSLETIIEAGWKKVGTDLDDFIPPHDDSDSISAGQGNDIIYGGNGNDYLGGDEGNDYLDGGSGNDNLDGGPGDDIFVFGRGYGQDWVSDNSGQNKILFSDLNYDDVQFTIYKEKSSYYDRETSNLAIYIKDSPADILIVSNGLKKLKDGNFTISFFEFADGTIKTLEEIARDGLYLTEDDYEVKLNADLDDFSEVNIYGSDGDDNIRNYKRATTDGQYSIYGGQGDDKISSNGFIYGEAGNDTLKGDSGNDFLYGGDGNDLLIDSPGDDYLEGGLEMIPICLAFRKIQKETTSLKRLPLIKDLL